MTQILKELKQELTGHKRPSRRSFVTVDVKETEIRPSEFSTLCEYDISVKLGTNVTCNKLEAKYAFKNVYEDLKRRIYADFTPLLQELHRTIMAEEYQETRNVLAEIYQLLED